MTTTSTTDFGHDPRQCDCAACQHIRYSASDAPLIEYAEARFLQGLIEGADWPRMVFRRLLDGREFSI